MRGQNLQGTLGGKVTIDRDDYPDVYMESKSLQLARVNQLFMRLAPLFLPTRVPPARVAMLATTESDMGGGPSVYYGETVMQPVYLFQMPFDVLRREQSDRIKDYDVLVLSALCGAMDPEEVESVKAFVARGGKLLILPPAAHTDARNLQPRDFGWAAVAGCKPGPAVDCGGEAQITVAKNDVIRSLSPGDALPGFAKLQTGKLPSLVMTDGAVLAEVKGKPVAAVSKDGRVVTACLPQFMPTWTSLGAAHFDAAAVKFFRDVFAAWKIARPVTLSGDGETHMVDAGVLRGPSYWLAFLASYSLQDQTATARLAFLPDGKYDVLDVTGERPLIQKDQTGQNHYAPDPLYRRSFFVKQNVSASDLRDTGVALELGKQAGRVLLVRPAGETVWVNCPGYELQALAKRPLAVVPGKGCEKLAERIRDALAAAGNKAEIVAPDAIAARKVANTVVVDGVTVDTFESAPLDVKSGLVLIGNESNNSVIRRLADERTFCFDKMLQKVDDKLPGPGRGLIEVVESVSSEAYDSTANSRDAIVIGGSDADGTAKSVESFLKILGP